MHGAASATLPSLRFSPEELAKAWLVRVVERTPLAELGQVEIDLLATDAEPLIAGILTGLATPAAERGAELSGEARERARRLGRLRRGERAPAEIPRDLAELQALLIESLRRDIPEREAGDFARSVERLAEIFGSVQGAVAEGLAKGRAGDAPPDELTGLHGDAELHEWMRILLAEHRRYGHPFGLALIDIEGLSKINAVYGHRAGDRMLAAVAAVIGRQVRAVDRAFRIGEDEICVLCPHGEAAEVAEMARRLARVIASSQANDGPRVVVAIGVASCPAHGEDPQHLLEVAEEATYSAKAAGQSVSVASAGDDLIVQDS